MQNVTFTMRLDSDHDHRAVRRLLKRLLRAYDLKCVKIASEPDAADKESTMTNSDKIGQDDSPKSGIDDMLLVALVEGSTLTAAAEKVGVSVRTVHRRLANAEFHQQYSCALRKLRSTCLFRIENAALRAIDTLQELLEFDDPKVRLGAARRFWVESILCLRRNRNSMSPPKPS